MRMTLLTSLATLMLAMPATAQDVTFVTKASAHSVSETLDRLENILEERGISVAARIDHAANATGVDMALPATQLLVFGNPSLGTPLMQAERLVGLDLPMKVLAYETEAGVMIAYTAPEALAARHGLEGQGPIAAMAGALDRFTDAATADD